MPSPTATMRPTSAETRLASKSFKRSFMTSEISRVLMLNSSLLRGRQPAAQLLQSSGDARVDDPVTVLQFHAAEDARIDDDAQPYVLVEAFRQFASDPVAIGRFELDRGRHGGPDTPRGLVRQALKLLVDVLHLVDAAGVDEQPREVRRLFIDEVRRGRDQRLPMLGRDRGVAQDRRHLRVSEEFADLGQAAGPLVDLAVLLCQLEDRPGVSLSGGRRHSQPLPTPRNLRFRGDPGVPSSNSHRYSVPLATCSMARSIRRRCLGSSSVSPMTFSVAATTSPTTWSRAPCRARSRSTSMSRLALSTNRWYSSSAFCRKSARSCSPERFAPSITASAVLRASTSLPSASFSLASASARVCSASWSLAVIWRCRASAMSMIHGNTGLGMPRKGRGSVARNKSSSRKPTVSTMNGPVN